MMVAIAVLVLRKTQADRPRSFRTPFIWVIAPLTVAGCVFLFFNLPAAAMLVLPIWGDIGLFVYFAYRSEEHTSELQSLMRISYAVFCLKKTTIFSLHSNDYTHVIDMPHT